MGWPGLSLRSPGMTCKTGASLRSAPATQLTLFILLESLTSFSPTESAAAVVASGSAASRGQEPDRPREFPQPSALEISPPMYPTPVGPLDHYRWGRAPYRWQCRNWRSWQAGVAGQKRAARASAKTRLPSGDRPNPSCFEADL